MQTTTPAPELGDPPPLGNTGVRVANPAPALRQRLIDYILALALLGVFGWLVIHYLHAPSGHDWQLAYRPAILDNLLRGRSPYNVPYFNGPTWALLPFVPIAFLPPPLDNFVMFFLALAAFAYCAYRLGARPTPLALFLVTPVTLNVAANGQIDWLVPLGLFLPRWLGLFFVLSKPQLGLGIAVYWLWDSYRHGGARRVVRDFAPVGAAFVISIMLYGPYFLRLGALLAVPVSFNVTFWPYGIPIGLALLLSAMRRRNVRPAIAAGAFFSPYVAIYSWSVPLLALVDDPLAMSVVCASLWLVVHLL